MADKKVLKVGDFLTILPEDQKQDDVFGFCFYVVEISEDCFKVQNAMSQNSAVVSYGWGRRVIVIKRKSKKGRALQWHWEATV